MPTVQNVGSGEVSGFSYAASKAWNLIKPTDQKIYYLVLGVIAGYQTYAEGFLVGLGGMAVGALIMENRNLVKTWTKKLDVPPLDTISAKMMLVAAAAFFIQRFPGFAVSLGLGGYAVIFHHNLKRELQNSLCRPNLMILASVRFLRKLTYLTESRQLAKKANPMPKAQIGSQMEFCNSL